MGRFWREGEGQQNRPSIGVVAPSPYQVRIRARACVRGPLIRPSGTFSPLGRRGSTRRGLQREML